MVVDKADEFAYYWRIFAASDLPEPEREFNFDAELRRKHRFDFAWPELKIAVEIDGGNRMVRKTKSGVSVVVGGHTQDKDYEKRNIAASLGWRVFSFTTQMLSKDGEGCVNIVASAVDMASLPFS